MVARCIPYWISPFLVDMLVFRGVDSHVSIQLRWYLSKCGCWMCCGCRWHRGSFGRSGGLGNLGDDLVQGVSHGRCWQTAGDGVDNAHKHTRHVMGMGGREATRKCPFFKSSLAGFRADSYNAGGFRADALKTDTLGNPTPAMSQARRGWFDQLRL